MNKCHLHYHHYHHLLAMTSICYWTPSIWQWRRVLSISDSDEILSSIIVAFFVIYKCSYHILLIHTLNITIVNKTVTLSHTFQCGKLKVHSFLHSRHFLSANRVLPVHRLSSECLRPLLSIFDHRNSWRHWPLWHHVPSLPFPADSRWGSFTASNVHNTFRNNPVTCSYIKKLQVYCQSQRKHYLSANGMVW